MPCETCQHRCADSGGTLVYYGADIDLNVLHHLGPNETRAVFIDNFHNGTNVLNDEWDATHKHETREYFRMTSRPLRPWRGTDAQLSYLRHLVTGRLRDLRFADVQAREGLRFAFFS